MAPSFFRRYLIFEYMDPWGDGMLSKEADVTLKRIR